MPVTGTFTLILCYKFLTLCELHGQNILFPFGKRGREIPPAFSGSIITFKNRYQRSVRYPNGALHARSRQFVKLCSFDTTLELNQTMSLFDLRHLL